MESYWFITVLGVGIALAGGLAIGYRIARRAGVAQQLTRRRPGS